LVARHTAAEENVEHLHRVGRLVGSILDDLLQGQDAANTDVQLLRAKSFQSFDEAIGDLATMSQSVVERSEQQGDAGPQDSKKLHDRRAKPGNQGSGA
jgi:hypothetical protein